VRMLISPHGRTVFGFLLFVGLMSASRPARADLLVSDLTGSTGSFEVPLSYGTSYAQYGAQQFITGGQSTSIGSVTVLLGASTYTGGNIVAELLNQVGNQNFNPPGSTILETFTATSQLSVAGGTEVTFTPTSSFTLAANTGYWFALGTTAGSTGNLNWTAFSNPVNTGSGTIYDEYTFGSATLNTGGRTGGEWALAINGSGLSITSVAPEPSSAVIAIVGTLIASGYWRCRRRGCKHASNPQ